MSSVNKEVAERIVGHAVRISGGACDIDENEIARLHDAGESELASILAGLFYLHQDLRYQEGLREQAQAALTKQADELRAQNEALEASRAALATLLEERSTPLITLARGVLLAPIIGTIDDIRASAMMERVLGAVVANQATTLILDITGVAHVDMETASHFARIADAVRLLGATCMVSGMRPSVAMAMTTAGIDFSAIVTVQSAEEALRRCLRRLF